MTTTIDWVEPTANNQKANPKRFDFDPQVEFNLPDEGRIFFLRVPRCPHHSARPVLVRMNSGYFKVRCAIDDCLLETAVFKRSRDAILCWCVCRILER